MGDAARLRSVPGFAGRTRPPGRRLWTLPGTEASGERQAVGSALLEAVLVGWEERRMVFVTWSLGQDVLLSLKTLNPHLELLPVAPLEEGAPSLSRGRIWFSDVCSCRSGVSHASRRT